MTEELSTFTTEPLEVTREPLTVTTEPLSREELALFYSHMTNEFNAKNEEFKKSINSIDLLNSKISKLENLLKTKMNSDSGEISDVHKAVWIKAAQGTLKQIGDKTGFKEGTILYTFIKFMFITITDFDIYADREYEMIADNKAARELFEELSLLIIKRLYPEKFNMTLYFGLTKESDELNKENAAPTEQIEQVESKVDYRSIPCEVRRIVEDYAARNNTTFNSAIAVLYKEIERELDCKLVDLKREFMKNNGIPYCTTAYMISKTLMTTLKNVAGVSELF